jgi:AMP-binding enzyme
MSDSMSAAANARADADQRPWLTCYPPGVPAEIDVERVGTLVDLFRDSVSRYATQPALESFGTRMTYAELGEAADAVASWLQGRGLGKGDRVAIMLPNVLAYPAILFGSLIAGCTVVNVNPLYTARELCHQVNDAGARILFVLENFGHTVEEAGSRLTLDQVVVVTPGDLMGLKGMVVNLVSRRVKKAVPFPSAERRDVQMRPRGGAQNSTRDFRSPVLEKTRVCSSTSLKSHPPRVQHPRQMLPSIARALRSIRGGASRTGASTRRWIADRELRRRIRAALGRPDPGTTP